MKKRLLTVSCLLGMLLIPVSLYAGLYYWTDENGIKHFSTHPPVGEVDVIEVIPEVEYDEAADEARMQDYREWRQNQRENYLEKIRRAEAEEQERIAEKRRREEALKKALEKARLAREKERLAREREERLYEDDTDDETIFVQPKREPLGIEPNEEQRRRQEEARESEDQPLGQPGRSPGKALGIQ